MDAFCRTLYGLFLPHRLNVETVLLKQNLLNQLEQVVKLTGEQMTRTEPAQVKYTKRLKAVLLFVLLSEPAQST